MRTRVNLPSVSVVAVIALLVGCGGSGGGGGGGGGEGENRVRYAGATMQATITEQNADLVVEGVAGGVPVALDLFGGSGVLLRVPTGDGSPARLSVRDLTRLLTRPVASWLSSGETIGTRSRATLTQSDSMPGSCGGHVRYRLSVNETTGALDGRLSFSSDFCDDGVQIAGAMAVTGVVDLNQQILWLDLATDRLDVRDPDAVSPLDVSLAGTFGVDARASAVTLSVAFRDNVGGQTVKFEDFAVSYEDGVESVGVTITGRYYEPEEGYVDFVTPVPVILNDAADGPSAGVVTALGAEGTASRLTALTAESYRIDADLNGDGDYDDGIDWHSGVLRWSDL